MTPRARFLAVALLAATSLARPAAGDEVRPSRPPVKGCAWEKATSEALGLEAWVQRCDFGFRKIDFVFEKNSLAIRYSDGGGKTDPLVDVFDLQPEERIQPGIKRIFAERSKPFMATRCILVEYRRENDRPPAGVERYAVVPNRGYRKELSKRARPDEVPDPPCGDFGESADGVRYWEAQPRSGARKVLFVRVGQDEPLFDERTLRLLPPAGGPGR
ncbi:MAG TPA: hypothetical protein PLB02_00570 [Thermoanaerobaculia bacterium]|nr:hypothetical protein [Thermoanaerobaculia bacterium]HQR65873.1 hypothetical protein [Thermoanaerobaculia bacterium]